MATKSINADFVYVNDVDAPYGAYVQVIHRTSGDVFTLGSVDPDGTACYSLSELGFAAGQEFTVTLQAIKGGAKADTTVITYRKGTSTAAGYLGKGALKDPEFKYTGIFKPAPPASSKPPPADPIKVRSVFVDDSQAPYQAAIQIIDETSGDDFFLGDVGFDDTKTYPLHEVVGLTPGQTFTVTLQVEAGGAWADQTVITYDPGAKFSAAYSGTGSSKIPCFKYTGRIPDVPPSPPSPPPRIIEVDTLYIENLFITQGRYQRWRAGLLQVKTTSGEIHGVGSFDSYEANRFYSLDGILSAGQKFTTVWRGMDNPSLVFTYRQGTCAANFNLMKFGQIVYRGVTRSLGDDDESASTSISRDK